jgi:sugar phosphate isomerase/epimerase
MQVTWSIFPKFQNHLDPHGLAALIREVDLDTTNLVVRDGFWVTPKNLAQGTMKFVAAMKGEGVEIACATTSYTPQQLIDDPTPIQVFHDNGIRAFRIGHVDASKGGDVRGDLKRARGQFEQLAALCDKHDVRAIYQLHHNTLMPSPSSVFPAIDGLPSDAIGVELDPGNQSHEGHEDFFRSVRLLRGYVAWAACKDSVVRQDPKNIDRPDKGWRRTWAPAYEGVVRWDQFFAALASIDFHGVIKLMPFYDEKEPERQKAKLKKEVAYLKKLFDAANRKTS